MAENKGKMVGVVVLIIIILVVLGVIIKQSSRPAAMEPVPPAVEESAVPAEGMPVESAPEAVPPAAE